MKLVIHLDSCPYCILLKDLLVLPSGRPSEDEDCEESRECWPLLGLKGPGVKPSVTF